MVDKKGQATSANLTINLNADLATGLTWVSKEEVEETRSAKGKAGKGKANVIGREETRQSESANGKRKVSCSAVCAEEVAG